MLFLDGVYVDGTAGGVGFHGVKAATSAELAGLAQTLARRVRRSGACWRSPGLLPMKARQGPRYWSSTHIPQPGEARVTDGKAVAVSTASGVVSHDN